MAHDVFVSYATSDKPIADAVCATLEKRGIRCWIAPRDILPGLDWGAAIVEAIGQSKIMALVFSANANKSPQIKREVERAVAKGVTIVPFRIEDVPLGKTLEYFISTPHWLDAFSPPVERHAERLAETVALLLARPSRASSTAVPVSKSELPGAGPAPKTVPASAPRPALAAGTAAGPGALKPKTIAAGVALLALVSFVALRLSRSSAPEIVAVQFPPVIAAGNQGTGSIQFRDRHGDVAMAQFRVVQATSFQPFSFEPPVSGQKAGTFPFWIRSAIPQRVTLQAVLVDREGHRSNPAAFSFEVKRQKPSHRSLEIQVPNGIRFKVR